MSNKTYHKALCTVMTCILTTALSFVISSCSQSEVPEQKSFKENLRKSGPLIEQDTKPITLTDELGEDANDPKALAIHGDRYFENGKYSEAIDIYKKVLTLDPNDVDTYNDLGLAYAYVNQIDKSIDTLRKGTEIKPSYQRIWISLGFVSSSVGMKDQARSALTKAVQLGPETPIGKEASKMLGQLQ